LGQATAHLSAPRPVKLSLGVSKLLTFFFKNRKKVQTTFCLSLPSNTSLATTLLAIVCRSGLVVGVLDFRFWSCYWIIWIKFFLKKQNDIILVKIKINGLQLGFWPGYPGCRVNLSGQRGHIWFFLLLFFFNLARF
jgi:hypothetical protein